MGEDAATKRVLVVARCFETERSEQAFLAALATQSSVAVEVIKPADLARLGALIGARGHLDAVVVFVAYRDLLASSPLDWGGFTGLRVMLEHDAWQNYAHVAPHLVGTWPEVFRRHRFDLMVVSGRQLARRLVEDGVRAEWVAKGFDSDRFYPTDGPRAGYCTFGASYPARLASVRAMRRASIAHDIVKAPYHDLNGALNHYLGCVVCNLDGWYRLGVVGKIVRRVAPGALVDIRPGIEPMLKNFEAAASGCAVFANDVPDLLDLGFVHGESVLTYTSLDELIDLLLEYESRPDLLLEIGSRAAALCRERHAWPQRAVELLGVIEQQRSGRQLGQPG